MCTFPLFPDIIFFRHTNPRRIPMSSVPTKIYQVSCVWYEWDHMREIEPTDFLHRGEVFLRQEAAREVLEKEITELWNEMVVDWNDMDGIVPEDLKINWVETRSETEHYWEYTMEEMGVTWRITETDVL
jgi:hypothetical protein